METVFALAYYFKEVISANFDLFYILTGLYILYDVIKKEGKIFLTSLVAWTPVLVYGLIQILVIDDIDESRLMINIGKIFICIALMMFVKEYASSFDIIKFSRIVAVLFTVSIPVSFILFNGRLWRIGDHINKFADNRLKLFYDQPGGLSVFASLIIVLLIYFILKGYSITENAFLILCMFIIIYLSAGMGGLLFLAVSVVLMLLIYSYRIHKEFLLINTVAILLIGILFILFLAATNNSFYLRAIAAFSGNDSSTVYRINIGFDAMLNALNKSNAVGVGFGNLNTERFKLLYGVDKFNSKIADSFMYFITEGGIFAVTYLLFLLAYVFRKAYHGDRLITIPILVFAVLYQIPGGYFTNPIFWMIYGFASSGIYLKAREQQGKGFDTASEEQFCLESNKLDA